jgi:hypothetical protein
VLREFRALLEQLDLKAFRDLQEQPVYKVYRVSRELQALLQLRSVLLEQQELMVQLEPQAHKEFRDLLVQLDHRVCRVFKVYQVVKVQLVQLEQTVLTDLQVQLVRLVPHQP